MRDPSKESPEQPLLCDRCGGVIAYVHEFDLNGSFFVCISCMTTGDYDSVKEYDDKMKAYYARK